MLLKEELSYNIFKKVSSKLTKLKYVELMILSFKIIFCSEVKANLPLATVIRDVIECNAYKLYG
jgi:hypothetical protein